MCNYFYITIFKKIDYLESRLAKTFVDTLLELKFSDAPIISKNNNSSNSCKLDKGKCLVCGSNQDWKDILKLEISKENSSKAKKLKDIQIASSKLGFGSYSKFLENCDHDQLLTDINIMPLKKSIQKQNLKNADSFIQNNKKFLRNSTSSTYYANQNSESTTKNDNLYPASNLVLNKNSVQLPSLNFSGNNYFSPTNETYKSASTKGINNVSTTSDEKTTGFITKFQIKGKYKKNQKKLSQHNLNNESNVLIKDDSDN
jgi:hypothetical protein